jgi:hypothetical protein
MSPQGGGPLVSFEEAKAHLQIRDDDHDDEITAKLAHASGIVRDYLKDQNDPTWTDLDAPLPVQAAVLTMLGHLYEHRGDDLAPAAYDEKAWEAVARLLARFRDPALA